MFCRYALIVVVIGLTLPNSISFGQTQTPLDFAQRRDVGREIKLQPMQRAAIQALGPVCDAQCQAYVALNFNEISDDARLAFGALSTDLQNEVVSNQEELVQEQVELNAIDEVLANPQMNRFRELWTQYQGVNSLTSDFMTEALGLSEDQLFELQDLQAGASDLRNACLGNSALTGDQQAGLIQNINNGVIDQSINILNDSQLAIFINLCGEPCEFDPSEDANGQEVGDLSSDPDIQDPDSDVDPSDVADRPAGQAEEEAAVTNTTRDNRRTNATANQATANQATNLARARVTGPAKNDQRQNSRANGAQQSNRPARGSASTGNSSARKSSTNGSQNQGSASKTKKKKS